LATWAEFVVQLEKVLDVQILDVQVAMQIDAVGVTLGDFALVA
jgi:hypothetical protein